MPVSSFAPCRTSAEMRFRGTPMLANPPDINVAPSGTSATASSKLA